MARTKDPNLSRHIIERTIETSVEKGMAKATSIEIAKGSGVTEATVFSHFGSIANLRKKAYLYAEDVFKTHFAKLASDCADCDLQILCLRLLDASIELNKYAQYIYAYELLDSVTLNDYQCSQASKDVEYFKKAFASVSQQKSDDEFLLWWQSKCVLLKYFALRVRLGADYSSANREKYVKIIFGDIL